MTDVYIYYIYVLYVWLCLYCITILYAYIVGSYVCKCNLQYFNIAEVVFRGTTNFENWIANADFSHVSPYANLPGSFVHQGFYTDYLCTYLVFFLFVVFLCCCCCCCSPSVLMLLVSLLSLLLLLFCEIYHFIKLWRLRSRAL